MPGPCIYNPKGLIYIYIYIFVFVHVLEIEDAIVCSPVVRYTLTHRSENSDISLGCYGQ